MKPKSIDQAIYAYLFPHPKPDDPCHFQALLAHLLVPEVRLETQSFYGSLSTLEAKYPGLDYSHPPHRARLSRFTWHRRLFRALDSLGVTKAEIAVLTKWEGTKWARERFEREQGIKIRDTTGEEIRDFVEPEDRPKSTRSARHTKYREPSDPNLLLGELRIVPQPRHAPVEDSSDEEEEVPSVGVELNERLRAAAAERQAGHSNIVMDEEWEQWLKDIVETGQLPDMHTNSSRPTPRLRPALPGTLVSESTTLHPWVLDAARAGRWDRVPEIVQDVARRHLASASLNRSTPTNASRRTIAAERASGRPIRQHVLTRQLNEAQRHSALLRSDAPNLRNTIV